MDEEDELESIPGIVNGPHGVGVDELRVQPQPEEQQEQGRQQAAVARPVGRVDPLRNSFTWAYIASVVVIVLLAIGVGYSVSLYKDHDNCTRAHEQCVSNLHLCKDDTNSCHDTKNRLTKCEQDYAFDKGRWDQKVDEYINRAEESHENKAHYSECKTSNAANEKSLEECGKNLEKCEVTVGKYDTLMKDHNELEKKCGKEEVQWNECKKNLEECKTMDTRDELNKCKTDYKLVEQKLNDTNRRINIYAGTVAEQRIDLNKCNNEKSQWKAERQQQHNIIEEYQGAIKEYRDKYDKLLEEHTKLRIKCAESEIAHKYELEIIDDHVEQQKKLEKLIEDMNKKYDKLSKDFNNFMVNERHPGGGK